MFIYNVTVNIANDVETHWVQWMKNTHMPDVMKTGCFIDCQLVKVLYVEDEGHTYSCQYKFLEMSDIEKYQKEFALKLQAEHTTMFKDKYTAFRTLLQIID
jgi:(2Fe-2S) ferredoxin